MDPDLCSEILGLISSVDRDLDFVRNTERLSQESGAKLNKVQELADALKPKVEAACSPRP